MLSEPVCLRVKGPFACFTRPEFHVERVSYPVITPSAARGILEAILMKPIEKPEAGKRHNKVGFRWHILRLGIVKKGVLFSILRNELGYEQHPSFGNSKGYDIMDKRTQRHSLILSGGTDENGNRQMLEYLIEAAIEVDEFANRPRKHNLLAKYHQMFLRRARAGQCYYQPFFGCREFSVAEWELMTDTPEKIRDAPEPEDFGFLFRDFDFSPVWQHWGDERNTPRPTDWTDPADTRNVPAADKYLVRPKAHHPPLHAQTVNGWIAVSQIRDGKVVAV